MTTPKLECPRAKYESGMRIRCTATGDYCGNVYWKSCKGWWALTANAARCPLREGDERGQQGTAGRSDPV